MTFYLHNLFAIVGGYIFGFSLIRFIFSIGETSILIPSIGIIIGVVVIIISFAMIHYEKMQILLIG